MQTADQENGSAAVAAPLVAGHTPGPWLPRDDEDGYAIEAFGNPSGTICRLIARRSVTGAADARLIAAAPDLLAALRLFIAWDYADRGEGTLEDALNAARAAIAKAST